MQLLSTTNNRSLARAFALVALLLTGALQVQEAGHDHWHSLDDSYSQCLVCKTTAAALPSGLPTGQLPPAKALGNSPGQQAVAHATTFSFEARGPPLLLLT